VRFNPFTLTNPHAAVLAKTGAGKSYRLKYELIQGLILGQRWFVIDPEHEYEAIAQALEGTFVRLAPGTPHRVNPFDLPPRCRATAGESPANRFEEKVTWLADWLQGVVSPAQKLTPRVRGELEQALRRTYAARQIHADPATHDRPPPILEELIPHLESGYQQGRLPDLAPALSRRVGGTLAMFNGPTNVDLTNPLTVFGFQGVGVTTSQELRQLGSALIFDQIWSYARQRPHFEADPITVLLEEAWVLLTSTTGGQMLAETIRRGRKYGLRLIVATQQVRDMLESKTGQTIISNCDSKFLLAMEAHEVALAQQTFNLTPGEVEFLRRCGRGEDYADCLLLLGQQHTGLRIHQAPAGIHRLIEAKPAPSDQPVGEA
jgi:type IV secretory pathway VirB4 component